MQKTGCVSVLTQGLEQKAMAAAGGADRPAVFTAETESQTWSFVSCP